MITNIPMNCWWSQSDAQKSYYFPLTSLSYKSTRVLQKMAHVLSTIFFQLLNGTRYLLPSVTELPSVNQSVSNGRTKVARVLELVRSDECKGTENWF